MSRARWAVSKISALPLWVKKLIVVTGDLLLIPVSLWLAISMRIGRPFEDVEPAALLFAGLVTFTIPVFAKLGLYRAVMRYVGMKAAEQIGLGVIFSAGILLAMMLMQAEQTIPRSSFLIYGFVAFVLIGGSRFLGRRLLGTGVDHAGTAVAIYGAGSSGNQLVALLRKAREYRAVAFLDDSPALQGRDVDGLPVLDPAAEDLQERLEKLGVARIFLSIPSASRGQRRRIIERLEQRPFHVLTVPGIEDIVSGAARLDELREVSIDDLLGRDSVSPRPELLDRCVRGKTVLVTGAGGSIGAELCRQIQDLGPRRLLLLELSEYALYAIDQELGARCRAMGCEVNVVPLLGSAADADLVAEIFDSFAVDTVYHAAAYKHVPLVEHNPVAGLWNNVWGTMCLARRAAGAGTAHFVLVSTDKAVRPTNTMGASKRLAELVLQALQKEHSGTTFSMVRFGNVLGSSGSVVPLFRRQIAAGGPVTVTHPEITRFFMTIPEAVQLIIQAGAMARGGDVFVLDMGEPVRILDLARRMIRLSGRDVRDEDNPDGDIEIRFSGLRPGEKLYEELLIGEGVMGTEHPRIMRAEEDHLSWGELETALGRLQADMKARDLEAVRGRLGELVSGYQAHPQIEDFTWRARNGKSGEGQVVPFRG